MRETRTYRAGQSLQDHCRACKADRLHDIIVVDAQGQPLRVSCGFCGSEHNYRGGPRDEPDRRPGPSPGSVPARPPGRPSEPMPLVSERERREPPVSLHATSEPDLERLLRRVIREEGGLTAVAPAERWRGGELVLRPGRPGVQEKTVPIDTFFHKIVMVRNRLRTLEQQINAADELAPDVKVKLQSYITACYGSLTTFNVLFAEESDRFVGAAQD